MGLAYAGVILRNKDLMPTTFHPTDPLYQKKTSSEHQRMLGMADVKSVAEQDTDKSDAPEMVPVTQPELDFKQTDIIERKAKFIDKSKQMSTTVSSKKIQANTYRFSPRKYLAYLEILTLLS